MNNADHDADMAATMEDDWLDESAPTDGRQAWFVLLVIGLITGAATSALYAVLWALSA